MQALRISAPDLAKLCGTKKQIKNWNRSMKLKTNNHLNYDLNDLMITMKNANKKITIITKIK